MKKHLFEGKTSFEIRAFLSDKFNLYANATERARRMMEYYQFEKYSSLKLWRARCLYYSLYGKMNILAEIAYGWTQK